MIILAIFCGLFLAFANGSNDNFKGVATLFGSGTTSYRTALTWATVTTFAGSAVALALSQGMIATFWGKGLVEQAVIQLPHFSVAVGLAAAVTVFVASRLGLPISTTHALTGALVGAGWSVSQTGVNFAKLGGTFFLPLLLSPLVAGAAAYLIQSISSRKSPGLGAGSDSDPCLCVGIPAPRVAFASGSRALHAIGLTEPALPRISLGAAPACEAGFGGAVAGLTAAKALDYSHFASAGVVSFARGLNDTPKIAALLLTFGFLGAPLALLLVGIFMAIGGWIGAKKVAATMSHDVTAMSPVQGFKANLVTGAIVIAASKFGLPVSTTHVSCGSLFGLGASTREANMKAIGKILGAWVVTLPLSAALGCIAIAVLGMV